MAADDQAKTQASIISTQNILHKRFGQFCRKKCWKLGKKYTHTVEAKICALDTIYQIF